MKVIDQTKICQNYKGQWVILDSSGERVLVSDKKLENAVVKYRRKFGNKEIPSSFKVPTKILPYIGCWKMKFSYVRYNIFFKPVVPVVFKFKNKKFPYRALIDTGADISIIHAEIAEQLGINLKDGENFPFWGICGNGIGYVHKVDLEIGGYIFQNVPIIFTKDINPYGFGILGHEGLFDKARLVFELAKKQFEIIPKEYRLKRH